MSKPYILRRGSLIVTFIVTLFVPFVFLSAAQSTPTPVPPLPTLQYAVATCVAPRLASGVWSEGTTAMPTPRSEMPAAVIGTLIYVPGGFGGIDTFEVYDTKTDSWTALAKLPEGRNHLMAVALGDAVYVVGGGRGNTSTPTDSAWKYDPATDKWTTLANMPEGRYAGAAVADGDYLYVVGGVGATNALLRYDPKADSWTTLAELKQAREHLAAAALDGKIYALAGRWSGAVFSSVEIFDVKTGRWTDSEPMKVPRSGFGAAVVYDHIVVAGGEVFEGGAKALTSVEAYHPSFGGWTTLRSLPVGIHGNPLVNVGDVIYLPGGSDRAAAIDNRGRLLIYSGTQ
jgi:N-acetylneuraminic acid mutarotase